MATNEINTPYLCGSRTAWGAIFGGTFLYLAIMATFGALGLALFASAGWSATGMEVWMTVLAIISLYFAGRAAGQLANVTERNSGIYQGLITFGMSFFATVLVLGIALATTVAPTGREAAVTRYDLLSVAANGGWALFVALFLGLIAAAIGGSHAVPRTRATVTERPDIRRVA